MNNNVIDLHGKSANEAVLIVRKAIDTAYKYGWTSIRVIHGFNNGTEIKTRIHQIKHKNLLKIIDNPSNSGETIFHIKMKMF